jgi:hypothetical protein
MGPESRVTRPATGSSSARAGYVIGAVVNIAMLVAVNVWPGWEAVPFLTAETPDVLPLVSLSLASAVVANIVYLVNDAPWVRALGGLVTTGVGLAALVRILDVFPVVEGGTVEVVARILLVVGLVGSVIGIVVQLVAFVRAVIRS